jgi:hypothetical protein
MLERAREDGVLEGRGDGWWHEGERFLVLA